MGYNQHVGWVPEAEWGTEVDPRTIFARPYEDTKLTHERPSQAHEHLSGRDADHPFFQVQRGVGNLSLPLTYTGMEHLFSHCLGAAIVTTGADPYVHTISLDDNPYTRAAAPLFGLTVELNADLPDASFGGWLLTGGRVRSFGSNFRTNEEVKLTVDLVGKQVIQDPPNASPTFPDYGHATTSPLVKFNQILLTIDTTACPLYGVEWNVNNNLRDDKSVLGSSYIAEPRATGRREITGTIDREWVTGTAQGKATYDKFIAGTPASILATATGPAAGPPDYIMTFRWNNVFFTGETPGLGHGEEDDSSLPFMAYEDATYGAFQIVNTNNTAAP